MSGGPPAETIELFQLLTRGVLVQAVSAAAKLGLADLLAEGERSADELARATGAHSPTLYRLLRALAGLGLFAEDEQGRFRLTPLGGALRSGPGSGRELAVLLGEPFVWAAWGNLRHSIMNGAPAFGYTHGLSLFEYIERHPEAEAVFHAWMTKQSQLQTPLVLAAYDFSGFRKIVDVGGGHGSLLAAILAAYPSLSGVLYDLPGVVEKAQPLQAPGIAERCELVGGSFFDSVPRGGDCYLLKLVLHDWDDERALRILRNVREAIADDGRVLALEFAVPPGDEFHHSKYMDLNMLVLTEDGRERTEPEFRGLYRSAGFALTRVVPTGSPLSIVEGAPV